MCGTVLLQCYQCTVDAVMWQRCARHQTAKKPRLCGSEYADENPRPLCTLPTDPVPEPYATAIYSNEKKTTSSIAVRTRR